MNILKTVLSVGIVASCFSSYGQHELPSFVGFTDGKSDTLTWIDKEGTHLLLLEQSEDIRDEEEATTSKTIKATHWLIENAKRRETWSIEDGIKDCPVDVEAKFLTAPHFTDLDDDGIYEVWFVLEKACKGDISPSEISVVMKDKDNRTHRLEAEQLLVFPDGSTDGGAYDLKDFRQLSKAHQDFATEYLLKNYRYQY